MVARNITRQPVKSLLGSLAIACTGATLVVSGFFFDSTGFLFDAQFQQIERQNAMVAFSQPLSRRAIYAIERLPGVLKVEEFRNISVKLSAEYRSRRVSLSGITQKVGLHRLVDDEGGPLHIPPDGLVVSAQLAAVLGIRPGDPITIEVLRGECRAGQVTLIRLSGDLVGVAAYADQHALARLLGEGRSRSGTRLLVDQHAAAHLYTTLKHLPTVNAVTARQSVIASFHKIMDENVRPSTSINFAFACATTFGMASNDMHIACSKHIQRLASLCVLGFTQAEVAWILSGEQFVLIAIVLPAGLLLDYGVCRLLSTRLVTDLYRLPLVVHAATFAYAFVVVGGTVVCSGLLVATKIRQLDVVAVLKAGES